MNTKMMLCPYCKGTIPHGVTRCMHCAGELSNGRVMSDKSRAIFILLAILFAPLGIHEFYIGYIIRGLIVLILTIFSGGMMAIIWWPLVILEIILTSRDAQGRKLR